SKAESRELRASSPNRLPDAPRSASSTLRPAPRHAAWRGRGTERREVGLPRPCCTAQAPVHRTWGKQPPVPASPVQKAARGPSSSTVRGNRKARRQSESRVPACPPLADDGSYDAPFHGPGAAPHERRSSAHGPQLLVQPPA